MEITGSLSTMSMPDLLQWLSLGGKTGVLSLERRQVRKMIFFTGGRIVSAASNDPREYFGQFLLRSKLLTEQELTEAFQRQRERHMMLGKILVEDGRLTEEQVITHLVTKAQETIFEAFFWRDGDFRFVESHLPEEGLVPISLDLTGLIAEGSRRLRELTSLRARFPSNLITFEVRWDHVPEDSQGIESNLLVLADDGRTLAEMCLELHESELTVLRAVQELVTHGALRPREQVELEAEELSLDLVEELIREGAELLHGGKSAEAVDVLRRAGAMGAPADVADLMAEATTRWRIGVDASWLDQAPLLIQEVPREELSPEEGFVLARANGTFSVDSISRLAPFESDEVLRIVKKYQDRGALRLGAPVAIVAQQQGLDLRPEGSPV